MTAQLLFIGTTELLLIGGMALLLFGGKKLPEMMRGLGQGVREFKKGVSDVSDAVNGEDAGGATPSNGAKQAEHGGGDTPVAEDKPATPVAEDTPSSETVSRGKGAATSNTADGDESIAPPTNATDGRQGY